MKVYKLTESDLTANGGFQYAIGIKAMPGRINPDAPLCGPTWLHAYPTMGLVVFMSPIHVEYDAPRLFEADAGGHIKYASGKLGCTELTLVREVEIPVVPTEARVEFAIRVVQLVIGDTCPEWGVWADNWLAGQRDNEAAAWAAAEAARAAEAAWAAEAAPDFEQRIAALADEVLAKWEVAHA